MSISVTLSAAPLASMFVTLPKASPLLLAGSLLSLAALAYGATCLALYAQQTKLIFRPIPLLMHTPAEANLAYEDVWIPVGAGQDKLHGWWVPCPGSEQVLLFCHGNYGNISYNLERIRFYHSLGFSVLAFDYRGYGQSTAGEAFPTESSTYADAKAAWAYLTGDRQITTNHITVCGHSMGGAIAIHLATEVPDMARLIVKSSFTTMKDAIDAKKIYSFFPVEYLLRHPFDSLSKVKKLKIPVLYVHGDQDPDIPPEMSDRLHAVTPEPKQLWFAPGADHNNICAHQGDTYAEVVKSFCVRHQLQSA